MPFTPASVVVDLGLTGETALSLIEALEKEGCLVSITARHAARLWATPSLVERLRHEPALGTAVHAANAPPEVRSAFPCPHIRARQ